jgi:hypothetical protein
VEQTVFVRGEWGHVMDPVTLVVSAVVAGASAGLSGTAQTAISDAYQALKRLVVGLLHGAGRDEAQGQQIVDAAASSEPAKSALVEALTTVGVDDPTRQAAQELLDLLESQKGKFVVDASNAKGVIIGDHSTQHNTFN